jgi:acyl-CoA synthetase (AMP-forming)/AMP-acid ligase II
MVHQMWGLAERLAPAVWRYPRRSLPLFVVGPAEFDPRRVRTIDELPRHGAGKVLERKLRDWRCDWDGRRQ